MRQMLFLSSDRTRKYAEDILTAVALPPGAMLQFRYDAAYVSAAAQRVLAGGSPAGIEAVIGFVSGVGTSDPFVLPVRYAAISSVEISADVYLFRFTVGEYVDLRRYPRDLDRLIAESRRVLQELMDSEKGTYYPVLSNLPDLRIRVGDDPPARWRETVLRLAQHQTFARSSFVRVDAIRTERGELMAFDAEGRLRATDGTSVRIAASFYNETYDADANRCVRCEVDGTFLRAASDSTYEIAHRYDTVEFWLHPTVRDATALAQIRLSAIDSSPSPVPVQTKLGIAVVIQRARRQLLLRALTAWLGAALVALPAILVESTPVGLRILSASVGALLIALVSVFMRSAV